MNRPNQIEINGAGLGVEIEKIMNTLKKEGFIDSLKKTTESLPPPPNDEQWNMGVFVCMEGFVDNSERLQELIGGFGIALAMSVLCQQPEFNQKNFQFNGTEEEAIKSLLKNVVNALFENERGLN